MESKKCVIFIDDEPYYFNSFLDELKELEIPFDFARDGSIGMNLLEKNTYNIVILDMKVSLGENLAQYTGYTPATGIAILERIRSRWPKLPVICHSVLNDFEIIQKINSLKAKYIPKGRMDAFDQIIDEIRKVWSPELHSHTSPHLEEPTS